MEGRKCSNLYPENRQDTSSQIKQFIKIQASAENRLPGGRHFTIAHLYLAPASLSRQNTKIEEIGSEKNTCKEMKK